jgi:hypothetical protein
LRNFARIARRYFANSDDASSEKALLFIDALWSNHPWMIEKLFKKNAFNKNDFVAELKRVLQTGKYEENSILSDLIEGLCPVMSFVQERDGKFYLPSKDQSECIILDFSAPNPITCISNGNNTELNFGNVPWFNRNSTSTSSLTNVFHLILWLEWVCADFGYGRMGILKDIENIIRQKFADYQAGNVDNNAAVELETDPRIAPEVYMELIQSVDKAYGGKGWI